MGILSDIWTIATETGDERRMREKQSGKLRKHTPRYAPKPTNHPDDHYGFEGLDEYAAKKAKKRK